jgi:hypothetical protein
MANVRQPSVADRSVGKLELPQVSQIRQVRQMRVLKLDLGTPPVSTRIIPGI